MANYFNNTMNCSFNCHGLKSSIEYIRTFFNKHCCDYLCLQETWVLSENMQIAKTIHDDYMYVATSGMDSRYSTYGGVFLFKKSLANYIVPIKCNSKRLCGMCITMKNDFKCLLFSIYMPNDNYSMSIVRPEFNNTIDCIELLLNSIDCNAHIFVWRL